MKKRVYFTIKTNGCIDLNIPENLVETLENVDVLEYLWKTHSQYAIDPNKSENINELFDLLNDKIELSDLDWDEIEIDSVEDIDYEN